MYVVGFQYDKLISDMANIITYYFPANCGPLFLPSVQHGRQREFLVREWTAKDGYYTLSIRYHYRYVWHS